MSETEAAVATEPTEISTPAVETSPEPVKTETQENNGKPAGYDPVDPETANPKEVKDRLDYLYRQVKHSDRDKREMQNLLRDQSRVIDELSRNQQAVVTHLTEKSFSDSKEQLKVAMQEAWKKGDNAAYIDAQNRLMDIQVEERVAAKTQRQQPQQPQNVEMPRDASEMANRAVQSGELSEDEYRTTASWQEEKDESGNLYRPWAFSTNPNYQAALFETRSVMANPRFNNLSYAEKLAEVDRRMGIAKRTASQAVMGGNLTKTGKSTKIELTPKQRDIALRTQYAGKGKSEADHLDAYRKQVDKFSQNRRAK